MTFKSNQGTGLVALRKNQEGFIAVKDVYNPIIQTISLGKTIHFHSSRSIDFIHLGADIRLSVSAWCVIDHADITLAYAYDNNIVTCSATSSRREQVCSKDYSLDFFMSVF